METNEIAEKWRHETRHILDCDIFISSQASQGLGGNTQADSGIEVTMMGDSLGSLREASYILEEFMNGHPDIIRVTSSVERANPQAEIVVDPLKAASKGLTPQMVTASIYTALNGSQPSEIRMDGEKYSIWVKYPEGRYQSLNDVMGMMVISATGMTVPLTEIASIAFTDSPQIIVREEGQYVATVSGFPTQAAKFTAEREILQGVQELSLPAGVSIGQSAMAAMRNDEFSSLGMAILTAILLVFMVLAIQFESIRHSLMVMTCLPFAVIGSFIFMYLTGTTLSMVSLLGFLVLVGMVINSGILFVDTANRYREDMDLHEALVNTGRTRLRPILMTTLTTILSMVPLAIGLGEGAEMMQGLGITVIGGLIASTFLALLLLPTFYLILDGNPEKRALRKQRRHEKREAKAIEQSEEETEVLSQDEEVMELPLDEEIAELPLGEENAELLHEENVELLQDEEVVELAQDKGDSYT
jgi:multidrug efflux pump subunit AcrB